MFINTYDTLWRKPVSQSMTRESSRKKKNQVETEILAVDNVVIYDKVLVHRRQT